MADRRGGRDDQDERAVFIISVAAELAGVHPQTLRIYERKGLVRPKRTQGNTRRYSLADVELLRSIQALTQEEGVNLAGVKRIMELRARMNELEQRIEDLQEQLAHRRAIAMPGRRSGSEIVPLRTVVRLPWQGERG
ncbi:MAG: heat shock protein transcriptional repressor HspR [Actinomycetota bacterium]